MRKLMLGVVLLWCGALFAQVNPYVTGLVGVNGNMGYSNPMAEAGVGLESQGPNYFFDFNARVAFDRKLETGDGHTVYASGMGYMKLGRAFVGGGMNHAQLSTSLWSKSRTAPTIGAMFNINRARIRANYQFAGTDKLNGGRTVGGSVEFFLTNRIRLVEQISVVSYHPTGQPNAARSAGIDVRTGIKFMLGKRPKTRQIAKGDD